MQLIRASYDEVSSASDVVLCEGTGHCAVGSIVNVNNAKVASMLGASMLLIANGGLGKLFHYFAIVDDFEHLFYGRLTVMSFHDVVMGSRIGFRRAW
jgi:hypothetical protein